MTDHAAHADAAEMEARLEHINRIHDDTPEPALALLRRIPPERLPPARRALFAFLVNHVAGEKFGLWDEALAAQQAIVEACAGTMTALLWRQAAVAAHLAGDEALARDWTRALAASADAPLDKARTLVAVGAAQFSVSRLSAEAAGRAALHALRPVVELLDTPGTGLDAAFGAVVNNLASELVERRLDDLAQPELRDALALGADLARRLWERAGSWVNRERAHYLCAMAANALGHGDDGVAQARAGLALLDEFDIDNGEPVDRAFLELELAAGLRLAGQPGRAEALARALALAARFGEPWLDRWFSDRQTRNEALAVRYGV